jgi:hypothetical protein
VDPLISKGIHCDIHATSTSAGSHYGDTDFDAIGRGHAPRKFDSDILALGSAAARGAKVLADKMSTACIHHQFQTSGA